MATTALQVFSDVMALTDNLDGNGEAVHCGTAAYRYRTVGIINLLLPSLYIYSDSTVQTAGAHSAPARIAALGDALPIDDVLAATVLAFGLAGHLLANENPAQSNLWLQRYDEELLRLKNIPAESEDIEDLYGVTDLSSSIDTVV